MTKCACPNGPKLFHNGAGGDSTCMECGVVISENALVSEVTFGETSGGAAMAHGTLVSDESAGARSGPGSRRGGEDNTEQAVNTGRATIIHISTALHLPDTVREAAVRFYKLAVSVRFTKGRRSRLVVAACLYAACQHYQLGFMLIDFSDLLQVNVFVLGSTYLKLIKVLHMNRPYAIDPAHYIARFAALLEFGDETPKVASDAVRLVKRFKADWMNTGRRPAGICGACLLLAARMNNFRRSVQEIVQVVKIADQTLARRLAEFQETASSQMTIADFRSDDKWLPESEETPPIIKAQKKKERSLKRKREGVEGVLESEEQHPTQELSEDTPTTTLQAPGIPASSQTGPFPSIDFNTWTFAGIGLTSTDLGSEPLHHPSAGTSPPGTLATQQPLFLPNDPDEIDAEGEPADEHDEMAGKDQSPQHHTEAHDFGHTFNPLLVPPEVEALYDNEDKEKEDDEADDKIAEEVEGVLRGPSAAKVEAELAAAAAAEAGDSKQDVDLLDDLDEDELDRFILNDAEVKLKTRVWVELNRDYLERLAAKGLDEQEYETPKKPRTKKPKQRPRDSTTARGATPAESVGHLLKKKAFSRKINYDAVKSLFSTSPRPASGTKTTFFGYDKDDDKSDKEDDVNIGAGLISMDDGFEDGAGEIIDEGVVEEPALVRRDMAGDSFHYGDGGEASFGADDYYDDQGYQEEV